MKVVLTGATGLVGGEVSRLLRAAGHDVLGVARRAPSGGQDVVALDCAVPDALAGVLRDREVLIHGAGISLGPAVAQALAAVPVARVVAVSSAAVASRTRASASVYRAGEDALLGPTTLLVRPTMIYGSRRDRNVHHAIDFARRFHFLPLVGRGAARIQPIHYRDLAAAIAELATGQATGVVHAGGAAPVTLDDAAAAIFDALGRGRRTIHIPYRLARTSAAVAERVLRRRLVERVDRMLEERTVDNSRLLELTTVPPRDFEAGVRDQVRETFR